MVIVEKGYGSGVIRCYNDGYVVTSHIESSKIHPSAVKPHGE